MTSSAELSAEPRAPDEAAVQTDGLWFGDPRRPALGWLSRKPGCASESAVVILPPVGYSYWSSHRTLRVLAERLARAGHLVLRFDYDGTGDSAGDQWDGDRVTAWRDSAAAAAAHMRSLGCSSLVLVGARLGATIALLDGTSLGAARIVAWSPVLSGRKYAREARLLSSEVPADEDPLDPPGTRVFAGSVFSAQTLAELAALSVDANSVGEAVRDGADPTTLLIDDGEDALSTAPEFAIVPGTFVDRVCEWIGSAPARQSALEPGPATTTFTWRGGSVSETVLRFGGHGHVGVLTEPDQLASRASGPTLVFLNPGSETHIGPGRAWVELARDLAQRGHRSIRVDFRGWGESPDAGQAPGRPYDAWCEQDTVEIVRGLDAAGLGPLALFGLCASAWILLRAVLRARVAGAIALNPQMYWQRGDPVDIDWDRIRARRAAEIERVERGHRLGLWSALDAVGHRPRVVRWLQELAATGLPIELLFAEGDDGLVYLRQRAGRRLERLIRGGSLRVRELPGVDHPMHRTWTRPRVVQALHESLEWIGGAAP